MEVVGRRGEEGTFKKISNFIHREAERSRRKITAGPERFRNNIGIAKRLRRVQRGSKKNSHMALSSSSPPYISARPHICKSADPGSCHHHLCKSFSPPTPPFSSLSALSPPPPPAIRTPPSFQPSYPLKKKRPQGKPKPNKAQEPQDKYSPMEAVA